MTLATLLQKTAEHPVTNTPHGWSSSWWLWLVIGFVVLIGILSFSGRGRPTTRV